MNLQGVLFVYYSMIRPLGFDPGRISASLLCLELQCGRNVGQRASDLPRPRAASRLGGSETRI